MDNLILSSQIKPSKRTVSKIIKVTLLIGISTIFSLSVARSAELAVVIPPPIYDEHPIGIHSENMVVAGGCFWGVQGVFQHVKGVKNAVSGYAGGNRTTANYENVSRGDTGHAESVQITYDPTQISYGKLLQIFFSVAHNPTELNQQGPDSGAQYRSVVFPTSKAQSNIVQSYLIQLNQAKVFSAPTTTRIETFNGFYPAEEHHQNFLTLNPNYPYIVFNDLPKIEQLKRLFPKNYQVNPTLVALASK